MLRIGVDEVAVPGSVIAEIHGHGSDDPTVKAIESLDWLQIRPAGKVASVVALWDLGPGESAVLSLALAEESSWAVIDDCRPGAAPSLWGSGASVLLDLFSWPNRQVEYRQPGPSWSSYACLGCIYPIW
jgi:hypothetical protein